ncbi:MAG: hypothetical protein GOVbin630_33 [Prokaryotic dsDNA virus sp.]|nr:MAG: hypothetical protein GOVbin630_33 [Prokaryotic dsDNA virus sp.]|tara:strand:- start:24395 stop:27343 length:2949 start_codon:yes stop_codon:yes gene_type:complete
MTVKKSKLGTDKKVIESKTSGQDASTDPQATDGNVEFNDQMFLVDMYTTQGGNKTLFPGNALVNEATVVDHQGSSANQFLELSSEYSFRWLHEITPLEYAQLTPRIILSLVSVGNDTEVRLPLVVNSNIEEALSSPNWYTTKTMGVKSLTMDLDGNTNPVSGKMYNIKLKLVFDSANTFFEGKTGGLTYAEIFRSYGEAGTAKAGRKTKLSIGYTGPPELLQKYALDDDNQNFTAYVDLVSSEITIKENLKVEVDVRYRGYEESLLNTSLLYDWLKVEVQEGKNERLDEELKNATNRILELQTNQQNQKKALGKGLQKSIADAGTKWINNSLKDPKTSADELYRAAEAMGVATKKVESLKHKKGKSKSKKVEVIKTPSEVQAAMEKKIYQTAQKGGEIPQKAKKFVETWYGDAAKAAAKIAESSQKSATDIAQAKIDQATAKRTLEASMQNVRMQALKLALEESVYDPQGAYFHRIELTSEQITNYVNSLRMDNSLMFNNITPKHGVVGSTSAQFKDPNAQRPNQPNGVDNETAIKEYARKKKELVKSAEMKKQLSQQAQLAKKLAANKAAIAKLGTPPKPNADGSMTMGDLQADMKRTALLKEQGQLRRSSEVIEKEIGKLYEKAKVFEEEGKVHKVEKGQNAVVGSAEQLTEALANFKFIEYIYLGDLIALLMSRIIKRAPGPTEQKLAKRTRILLTKFNFQVLNQLKEQSMYYTPISSLAFMKIISDKLYGTHKNTYTIFEVIKDMARLISLAQQRRAKLLGTTKKGNNFSLSYIPYPLKHVGGSYKLATLSTPVPNQLHGILVTAHNNKQGFNKKLDYTIQGNKKARIPTFLVGGQAKGALKSISMKEINNEDMKKAIFEKISANSASPGKGGAGTIPALFETTIKLLGTSFFHLGTYYCVLAPTLTNPAWISLQGYYNVKNISHEYNNGAYTTTITGLIQSPRPAQAQASTPAPVKVLPAWAASMWGSKDTPKVTKK